MGASTCAFFDQQMYEGRSILVRYVWSNITPKSTHFEQSVPRTAARPHPPLTAALDRPM
jgi:hypothetical protein